MAMRTLLIRPAWPGTIRRARARAGRWLGLVAAAALAAAGLPAVAAAPAWAAAPGAGAAPAPVSNAFALGGGLSGQIDPRTGAFQASLPLAGVAGRAGAGLSLTLSYDQSLAAQGTDRFGLGAGWSLGVPWINTAGGVRVYPASGGSYAYDAGSPTGLHDYPLRDLTFAKASGAIPARPGAPAQQYAYTLTTLDGTTDRFDASGNLIEQADRFGNPIDLTWQQAGTTWQPATVTDSYGQVTRFDHGDPALIKIISPPTAGKITATVTLDIRARQLDQVTDAAGQQTTFDYGTGTGPDNGLLTSVTSPAGERTGIGYIQPLGTNEPNLVVAHTVDVTDAAGHPVLPELKFDINLRDNPGQHNYTGYPAYNGKAASCGCDALFDSRDPGYSYTTALANGTSTVESTYNSLHLLTGRKVYITTPAGTRLNQDQAYTYLTPAVPPAGVPLPANYAKPAKVKTAYGDPAFGTTRTTVTSSAYNDQGELTSATTAAGTVTGYTYFSYGLPHTQTETGTDGTTSITTSTLTADGKSVQTTSTATGATAAAATARTVTTYGYNDFGQVTSQKVTWAAGAQPPGNSGGPDQMDTTRTISTDTAAHTQTDVVTTAADTPDAASATTVTDLVTGQVLSQTTPAGLTTTRTYDALGRPLTVTAPGGLTTRTAYTSPTVTTVTAPSGLITQTTTDLAGRTVKVTDNVSGGKLVTDPAARTLQTDTYAADGTQLATTTPAGTTTTTFDPLGRPVTIARPGGLTQTDQYDDVANTQTITVLAAGATSPTSVTTDAFNNLNQPLSSAVTYPDGTPQAPAAKTYDGLGRAATYTTSGLTATPDYAGAGGLQTGTTFTPADTGSFPGTPLTTATGNTMTGALTAKTLTADQRAAAAGPPAGTAYTYNPAGQVDTATTPAGARTSYTYTPDGKIKTVTQPSGTVTTYTYDPATGRLDNTKTTGPHGATTVTAYTYDPATGQVKTVYNPSEHADAISYDYDADGHLTAVHYPDGTATTASYADNGELATTTDVTGAVTTYTYNPGGSCGPAATDLCTAVQARGGTTLASVGYTYDALNRVHTITRGNHVTTTLTYTDASQVHTQTVTTADGTTLRADTYTYDSHGNPATRTTTTTLPAAGPRRAAGPATTTTAYAYDAYNRLKSSKVYPGDTAAGTPVTATSYTIDPAGNITSQDTTTPAGTTTTTNTIQAGQLTARTTGGKTASQDFNEDGAVITDLAGDTYTYTPAGQQASVTTPAKVTTYYAYWPDGTRRTATTTAGGTSHVITYHYATSGQIANDTYTGGGPAITASYLLAAGREARTLDTASTSAGTGYYLTDAHGSVTAMTGDSGQATASYAYGDYGQPAGPDTGLQPVPAAGPAGNAAVNPFIYDGAYTNPATGTQYLPARTYDPGQGRFLSLDAAGQLNRYQAFATNPITNTDPTGQDAVPQILTDVFTAFLCLVLGIVTAGAAVPVLAAAVAGEEIAAAAIVSAVANTVSAVTNIAAGATSATLAANDAAEQNGDGFLSDSDKENLNTATFSLGIIATATGIAAAATDLGAKAAEEAVQQAPVQAVNDPAAVDLWNGGGPPPTYDPPLPPHLAANDAANPVDPNANPVDPNANPVDPNANPANAAQVPEPPAVELQRVANIEPRLTEADINVVQPALPVAEPAAQEVPAGQLDTNPALEPGTVPEETSTPSLGTALTQTTAITAEDELNRNFPSGSPPPDQSTQNTSGPAITSPGSGLNNNLPVAGGS
jgi:RHS repeat-associated protein